jgi:N-acetylglucosamine kinase
MIIAFDIGGSAIKAARAASPDALVETGRVKTPLDDFEAFAAAIAGLIGDAEPEAPVAIAITGVVDPASGRIKCANIPCIDGRALAADLRERLRRPVHIANDADCFALAEARRGAGRGTPVVFGAILGTGVGGGLVINGHLVSGGGGFAGEWGHGGPVAATLAGVPPVEIPRFACGCGQMGCVDTIGGARGLERLHRHLHGLDLASTEIIALWRDGDEQAERTIGVYVDLVSGPLSLVVNTTGAGIVPVGGGLARATDLIARLDHAVRNRILRATDRPLLVPGMVTPEPGLVGAALLAAGEG